MKVSIINKSMLVLIGAIFICNCVLSQTTKKTFGCMPIEKGFMYSMSSYPENDDIVIGDYQYMEKKVWALSNDTSTCKECNNELAKQTFLNRMKYIGTSSPFEENKKILSMMCNLNVITHNNTKLESGGGLLYMPPKWHMPDLKACERWYADNHSRLCIDTATGVLYLR